MNESEKSVVELAGEQFQLSPLNYADWLAARDALLHNLRVDRLRAVAALRSTLPDIDWAKLWSDTLASCDALRTVTKDMVAQWLDTPDGVTFSLHRMLSRSAPGRFPTVDAVRDLIGQQWEQVRAARERLAAPMLGRSAPVGMPPVGEPIE
jgi:hypothetical protein